jgi:tRNA pseudouridine38-40 synthase
MKRIVLGVQYDGAPWKGWQTQPGGGTVQDVLEEAIANFTQRDIRVVCAGRTDAGVHALEQVAHFDTDLDRKSFSWVLGLNTHLPRSIAVRWACEVEPDPSGDSFGDFHARFSAKARTYHYFLYNHPVRSPLMSGRSGWVFRRLELEPMRAATRYLVGEHDFSAFRSSQCQAKSPIRLIHEIAVERRDDMIIFRLRANAFLHHMVRNIVGSLVLAGTGNQPPEWINDVLESRDRSQAAPTFMPDGLYLAKIDYDVKWRLPQEATLASQWA